MIGDLTYSSLLSIFNKESQTTYSWPTRVALSSLQHAQLLAQNISFL